MKIMHLLKISAFCGFPCVAICQMHIFSKFEADHQCTCRVIVGSATPKINVKQSGRLVVVLIVLNGSNTLALTNPRDRCSFSGN